MLSVLEELKRSRYAGTNRYLGSLDFGVMMLAAAFLHLVVIVAYHFMPDPKPETVPVRVLNVRLGAENGTLLAADAAGEPPAMGGAGPDAVESSAPVSSVNAPASTTPSSAEVRALDAMLSQLQSEDNAKSGERKRRAKPATAVNADNSLIEHAASTGPVKYVRRPGEWGDGTGPSAAPAASGGEPVQGSPMGNSSAAEAELLRRYEQVISLWVARNKIYPPEAFARGLQGEAVVRVRINRQGRILSYRIEQSSGHALIDSGLGEMVKRSNPVPAVPENYPGGKELEFLIPVSFYDQRKR